MIGSQTWTPAGPVQLVRKDDAGWEPLAEPGVSGIYKKTLRHDEEQGRAPTFLLRFDAGASYPAHDHPAGEEAFVLDGEVNFGPHHLKAGDYLYTPPNGKHAVWTAAGCVVLLCVPEAVRILQRRG